MADNNLTPKEAKDIFIGIVNLEEKRIEVEKLREKNVTKELELSEKSALVASELAKKDMEFSDEKDKRNNGLKTKILNKIFIIGIIVIISIISLIIILCFIDRTLLDKVIAGFYDLLKFIIGGIIGFFIKASQKVKKEKK